MEKSEYETLFIDCVENVRKEVMKRRLKNELLSRKKLSLDTSLVANDLGNKD